MEILKQHGVLDYYDKRLIRTGYTYSKRVQFDDFFEYGFKAKNTFFLDDNSGNIDDLNDYGFYSVLVENGTTLDAVTNALKHIQAN